MPASPFAGHNSGMSGYRHILLDADGTFLDFASTEKIAVGELFFHFSIPGSRENLAAYHAANSECWRLFEEGAVSMEELKTKRFADFFAAIGRKDDPYEAGRLFVKLLSKGDHLIPGALQMLEELSERAELTLVTNGIAEVQRGRLAASGTERFFRHIAISEELGWQKPRREFFDAVLEMTGTERKECLVVGDSLTSDIQGAINSGLDSFWLHLGMDNVTPPAGAAGHGSSYRELLSFCGN